MIPPFVNKLLPAIHKYLGAKVLIANVQLPPITSPMPGPLKSLGQGLEITQPCVNSLVLDTILPMATNIPVKLHLSLQRSGLEIGTYLLCYRDKNTTYLHNIHPEAGCGQIRRWEYISVPYFCFEFETDSKSPVSALGGPAAITDQDLKFQFSYIAACFPRQVRPAYMVSDCTERAFVAPCKTNRSHTWMCLYLLTSYLTISSLVPTQNTAWFFFIQCLFQLVEF